MGYAPNGPWSLLFGVTMNAATTFFIILPLVMLIVTFLPPYSRAFGFDQVVKLEQALEPLPQLSSVDDDPNPTRIEPKLGQAPTVFLSDLSSIVPERSTPHLPAPRMERAEADFVEKYDAASDIEEAELVDIPEDWQPGGKNARIGVIRYVDFSEQDRFSISDVIESDKADIEDPEVLDVVRGYWSVDQDQAVTA
jgi:hypothetical protein